MARLRVRELAQEQGMNLSQLQRESRLTMNMVRRYWYNTADGKDGGKQLELVSLDALDKLAAVFKVKPGDLISSDTPIPDSPASSAE